MTYPTARKPYFLGKKPETFSQGREEFDPYAGLTPQEVVFVEDYVRKGDAMMAALQAGYSHKESLGAYLMLSKPAIRRAVRVLRATQRESYRQIRSLAARGALETSILMIQDEATPAQVRAMLISRLMDDADITPSRDMQEDFGNDAVLEAVSSKKVELALQEYVEGMKVVVETKNTQEEGADVHNPNE